MFVGEIKESMRMALGALMAHKLRSALTLLGVLVGVFSIIAVMTAMRVLQRNVETELSELGSHTFAIQKWPAIYFGGPEGFEKYWRRKSITLAHGLMVQERATLARHVGLESDFWGGEAISRYDKTPPTLKMMGGTPGSFPAHNWVIQDGRAVRFGRAAHRARRVAEEAAEVALPAGQRGDRGGDPGVPVTHQLPGPGNVDEQGRDQDVADHGEGAGLALIRHENAAGHHLDAEDRHEQHDQRPLAPDPAPRRGFTQDGPQAGTGKQQADDAQRDRRVADIGPGNQAEERHGQRVG